MIWLFKITLTSVKTLNISTIATASWPVAQFVRIAKVMETSRAKQIAVKEVITVKQILRHLKSVTIKFA